MKGFSLLLLAGLVVAKPKINPLLSDERIAEINSKATTWKAGRNFDATTPLSSLKRLTGALQPKPGQKNGLKEMTHEDDGDLPESWDARDAWPNCASIKMVWDQSNCGSCWAFGAAEAMSDRICIHSGQQLQTLVSPEHLNSCCFSCGSCAGGWIDKAWLFWQTSGLVTGGLYNTTDGCQAYSMIPCEHHTEGDRPHCDDFNGGDFFPTPECRDTCDGSVDLIFENELTFGQEPYYVRGVGNIKKELVQNGPLEVLFDVYDDFLNYKSGVYQQTSEYFVGLHAVKLIGWGIEGGVEYWLLANSWNEDWGENGFFRIVAGKDECGIEDWVIGALPVL